jgi:purine nucleosidase
MNTSSFGRFAPLQAILLVSFVSFAPMLAAQTPSSTQQAKPQEKIIIDTDIGDDIDDAFAVALALHSPELQILGVTTTFRDTETRAKIADRLLGELGREDIPVAAGVATPYDKPMSQQRYAEGGHFAKASHRNAVDFIVEQIRRYPNEITLVAIGPLMNVGALLDKDPAAFHQLKRVVIMGGSVERGFGDLDYTPAHGPDAEWNIMNDIPSAKKLFLSGVPLFVMPLDSTQLHLDEVKRAYLFARGTPTTDALTILYHQWGGQTPTLFDPMTIAYIVDPKLCPVVPLHIRVDDKGFTRSEPGAPNAQVCLHSNPEAFFRFYIPRVATR